MPTSTNRPTATPRLRLHRDEPETAGAAAPPTVLYRFPDPGAAPGAGPARRGSGPGPARRGRDRLVAAKVAAEPLEPGPAGTPCAVYNGGDDPDCLGRIVSSRQLVQEIERTLDRMQGRLSDFRDQMDRAFCFADHARRDDDLPPAA